MTSNVKITSKVPAYSLVSYTPTLQEYGSAIIYNIGRMFPVQEVVTLSPLVALKEGKALCAPLAQYSEEGVPTVAILHLSAVCDFVTVLVTSVWLKVQKYTTSAMCGDNKCVLAVYRAGAMYCDVRYRCVIQLYTHTIGI